MQISSNNLSAKDLLDCVHALCPALERHARQQFGDAVVAAAWQSFSRWGTVAIAHENDSYQSAFNAWWLFAWLPDDQDLEGKQFLIPAPDHAIAANYLASHRTELSPLQQRVIKQALTSPYSFYSLLTVEPDKRMRLKEIYTQRQVIVEADLSSPYSEGDVLFSAVLSVDGMSTLLGCMPKALSSDNLSKIEAHRKKWRAESGGTIDQRQLYLHDTELRHYYFVLLNKELQANLH